MVTVVQEPHSPYADSRTDTLEGTVGTPREVGRVRACELSLTREQTYVCTASWLQATRGPGRDSICGGSVGTRDRNAPGTSKMGSEGSGPAARHCLVHLGGASRDNDMARAEPRWAFFLLPPSLPHDGSPVGSLMMWQFCTEWRK